MKSFGVVLFVWAASQATGQETPNRTVRTADAFVTSFLVTEGVKSVVHSDRPNHRNVREFPSEHATAAFAIATVQASFDPKSALWWYGGATAIGIERVTSDEHHLVDVLAGAAIGYVVATEVVRRPRGLLLTPIFEHGSVGLSLTTRL